ncbi:DNA repair protein RadA [Candidatus Peregrinibacteria bacterium]|nr:MAG: DNA repair protein RadA [Candidatus Peregrinibacteria bacterium]
MKLKTIYLCQNCGQESSKWQGRCPSCEEWNTFAEDVINVGKAEKRVSSRGLPREAPKNLNEQAAPKARAKTGIEEWDQVLGGGIVEGSLLLLSGEPGIGKSTLTMQVLDRMAGQKEKALYITGEESVEQVSDRARRLKAQHGNIRILYENTLENILATIEAEKPNFLVIDSIQVLSSNEIPGVAGSLSQVRYCTEILMNTIKTLHIPTLLIGHVNKEGNIAGPKVLEHLVDTVLILEGERDQELRMLRAVKNRFGPVSEIGLFEMSEEGLQEVKNPGERILENRPKNAVGSALTLSMEGHRPLLMEVQALVSTTHFGYPKRMASGFDRNRLELLIAVLQKHKGLDLADQDVYIKITGGLSLNDPAADLAVCSAIVSSFQKKPLPENAVFWGEMSLTGEIRKGYKDKERLKAAEKMGLQFQNMFFYR